MTVLRIEKNLHNFEDQKFTIFFNLEQVNFRVTLIIYQIQPGWPFTKVLVRVRMCCSFY